jgi:hypothetical protein
MNEGANHMPCRFSCRRREGTPGHDSEALLLRLPALQQAELVGLRLVSTMKHCRPERT